MLRQLALVTNNNADVILWGSGKLMREFLFVDDTADAVVYALENTTSH